MLGTKVKMLAGAGLLAGSLALASVGGAFAAPSFAGSPPASAHATGQHRPGVTKAARTEHLLRFELHYVAQSLGLTPDQLSSDLMSGQTLAQVATAQGKTSSDVVTTMTNALKTRLDRSVASGKITQAQEDQALAKAQPAFNRLVNANLSKFLTRMSHSAGGAGSQS